MSGIHIPYETEYLTYGRIKPYAKVLEELGINFIISHNAVKRNDELIADGITYNTREEILNPEAVPLFSNAIYLYCAPSAKLVSVIASVRKIFKRTLKKQYTVYLNLTGNEENDYRILANETTLIRIADVIFTSQYGPAGFYNIKNNLLWLGDLSHYRLDKFFSHALSGLLKIKNSEIDPAKAKYIKPNTLTWGADPEFEVYKNGHYVAANLVIPDDHVATVGCDGWNVTGEVRPRPSYSPLGLARNIKRLMYSMAFTHKLINYDVEAGGGRTHHLGGHVHVNTEISNEHALVLYDLVGQPILTHMQGPRRERADIIARGCWDAVRPNARKNDPLPHSGQEWRQLPSFIESEGTTRICLCTVAMVIKELQCEDIDPKKTTKMTLEEKVNLLKSMKLYEIYKEYVNEFIKRFYTETYSMEGKPVFKGWNIKKMATVRTLSVECASSQVKVYFPSIILANRGKSISLKIMFSNDTHEISILVGDGVLTSNTRKEIDHAIRVVGRRTMAIASLCIYPTRDIGGDENTDVVLIRLPLDWRKRDSALVAAHIGPLINTITKIMV
jgi:hypothetical protein